jgi:hypothetical protein
MGSGGLLQLVAIGAQDVYLTSNPQITFFRAVYRRHTNFSFDTVDVPFTNGAMFGSRSLATIPRQGDLLSKMYIRVVLSAGTAPEGAKWAWVPRVGHEIINLVQLSIGGQIIDRHTSTWLNVWHNLTHPSDKDGVYNKLVGDVPELTTMSASHNSAVLYIPLQFFNCRQYGNTIPMISLQYHNVELNIDFEKLESLIITSGFTTDSPGNQMGLRIEEASLVCDMILLDTDERRRFAQQGLEQLIEQVQWTGAESIQFGANRVALNFNHPIKSMYWVVRLGKYLNVTGQYKYLAYHPTDVNQMLLLATKRFALALARYSGGDRLVLNNNMLTPQLNLPANMLAKFTAIQAVAITTSPTLENITILGDLLTLEDISQPTSQLFAGITVTAVGDGAPLYDVTVRMPGNYGLYIDKSTNPMSEASLQFNGLERINRDAAYYNYIHPLNHHTRSPPDGLNVFSFALTPEDKQPSGSCNFSRLDAAVLSMLFKNADISNDDMRAMFGNDTQIDIMAFSYNVLRILSGMGGLAYSN